MTNKQKLMAFGLLALPFLSAIWASWRVVSVIYGLMLLWVAVDNYEMIAAGYALKKLGGGQ